MGADPGWKLVSHGALRLPPPKEKGTSERRDATAIVIELDRAARRKPRHAWTVGARRGDGRRIA